MQFPGFVLDLAEFLAFAVLRVFPLRIEPPFGHLFPVNGEKGRQAFHNPFCLSSSISLTARSRSLASRISLATAASSDLSE